jgi:acyl-coenzyme A synthetase/AMP-(fatty) acid ligase/3-hydroxymyristoyl/3-hydroxydecanoyl-(acyl carrier protein) dehydratase
VSPVARVSRLADLLCQEREPLSRIALRWDANTHSDRRIGWGEFVVDVARLRDRLLEAPAGGWVLLTEDAYSFAVGLFALWHSGRHAISPPNRQLGALRSPQTRAAGVLTDRPDWFPEGSTLHPLLRESGIGIDQEFTVAAKSFESLDDGALAVEFFTSGTTGDEKPVLKELRHLAREVEELGESWNDRVEGAVFYTSASHQHLYGMLFGVLWPLCSGHVFQAEHFLHAGELVPRLAAVERSVLASVPTHLKRLVQHAQSPQLRDRCCEVFSSGGPLPEETAHRIAELVGDAPVEVFGSTETGGIAWRRQTPSAADNQGSRDVPGLWTPFSSVEIGEDPGSGTLRVRSPFVSLGGVSLGGVSLGSASPASADSFTTGDRIEMRDGGRFELLGRTDRVVKIGERRLDLARMESELRSERWVDDVALTTLNRDGDESENHRADVQERVAAVVAPSDKGWTQIRESGRRALIDRLRMGLADAWDPVLHPRYWRFVLELPENQQGKVTQPLLRALFGVVDWGRQSLDRPEMLGETRSDNAIERTALVPSDLSCFPGHFPDRFIVPGVLQLDWALGLAEVLLGEAPEVRQIESLKLLMPLEPGARFRIRVESSSPTRLDLRLWFEDEVFAKGRVRIANPNE